MIRKTRRQALRMASAALLGGFATSTLGPPPATLAQQAPGLEPWEAYIDEKLEIEMSSNYFQVKGQEKNAPITLKVGRVYLLEFANVDKGVIGRGVPHNALFGKDPDLTKRFYKTLLFDNVFGIDLEGGQEGEFAFRVPDKPGEWEMGSFVTGQYEAGMKATLIIKK